MKNAAAVVGARPPLRGTLPPVRPPQPSSPNFLIRYKARTEGDKDVEVREICVDDWESAVGACLGLVHGGEALPNDIKVYSNRHVNVAVVVNDSPGEVAAQIGSVRR